MATREEMTVHKALCELKILDSKIVDTMVSGTYCIANKHSNKKINGISVDEFKKNMQGSYDKVCDLMKRQEAIKRAVTNSNAVTTVNINGEDYTVAEAIWMKNHGCDMKKNFIAVMKKQFNMAQNEVTRQNGKELEQRADSYVTAMYGTKENRGNSDDIEKTRNDFITASSFEIVDPLNVNKKIEQLQDEVDKFMSEVDSALSVSNAITKIVVEY